MRRIGIFALVLAGLSWAASPVAAADGATKVQAQVISKAEATRRAQLFFDGEIAIEGALGAPIAKGTNWVFPVKLGYAGTVQRDPILVHRHTGAVSWAGLPSHKAMLRRNAREPSK